jgi:hypothetical protein
MEYDFPYVGERIICTHLGFYKEGANAFVGIVLEKGENLDSIVIANGSNDNGIIEISYGIASYGIITDIKNDIIVSPVEFIITELRPDIFCRPIKWSTLKIMITNQKPLNVNARSKIEKVGSI